jgi:hypothetical protein
MIEPWMIAGKFVICTATRFLGPDGLELMGARPIREKVYIVAGPIEQVDRAGIPRAMLILAEFPHRAFTAEHFRPVPQVDVDRFILFARAHTPIIGVECVIRGRVH